MRVLKVQTPNGRDRARFLAQGGLIIGRDSSCDVVVNDSKVSRRHASLTTDGDGFILEDLGSSNGTIVRGTPIKETRLSVGDRFQIGGVRFEIADAPESTTLSHDTEEGSAPIQPVDEEPTEVNDVSDYSRG